MARKADISQGVLFGDSPAARLDGVVGPAPVAPETKTLADRVHAKSGNRLHMGTSSWSFPGWKGLVWDRTVSKDALATSGLAAYASHPLFRTVGLDRTFYAPMSEQAMSELAAMTPPEFSFLVKAHQVITRPGVDEHGQTFGKNAGHDRPNPDFLSPSYAIDRVIGPTILGLASRCGPIVFQFPPMDLSPGGQLATTLGVAPGRGVNTSTVVTAMLDKLEAFTDALPRRSVGPKAIVPLFAVEVRNRELLTPRYVAMLRSRGIVTALAGHPSQPPLAEQVRLLKPTEGHAVVVRWLLHPTEKYETAKSRFEPFDQLVDQDPLARMSIAELCIAAMAKGLPTWIVANNKAEGSAPRSIERLAQQIAAAMDGAMP
jgi:uncharacterized protein YecE (DUF72 family)